MKILRIAFLFIALQIDASPKNIFWTYCDPTVVPKGSVYLSLFDAFTLFNDETLPTDLGANLGVTKWRNVSLDAGLDYYGATNYPLSFNAKVGIDENILFENAPACALGIFGVGTKTTGANRTNYNVIDIIFGKTLPHNIGVLNVGFTSGSSLMGKNRQSFMYGYYRGFCPDVDCHGVDYFKYYLAADYFSGKSVYGGGGISLVYSFDSYINFQFGKIWFNNRELNGKSKWAFQFNAIFPVF